MIYLQTLPITPTDNLPHDIFSFISFLLSEHFIFTLVIIVLGIIAVVRFFQTLKPKNFLGIEFAQNDLERLGRQADISLEIQRKYLREVYHMEDITILYEQMTNAESYLDKILENLSDTFGGICRENLGKPLTECSDYSEFNKLVDAIKEKARRNFRLSFRENHLEEKNSEEFENYILTKFGFFFDGLQSLFRISFNGEIPLENVLQGFESKKESLVEIFRKIYTEGRKISKKNREKIEAIKKEMNEKIQKELKLPT